jgi:hypothetical protein
VAELAGFTRRECHSCSDACEWFNRPLGEHSSLLKENLDLSASVDFLQYLSFSARGDNGLQADNAKLLPA